MDRTQYLEAMLAIMERKQHWAWPLFTQGKVASDKLHIHFEQEYATYVRDFPVMVGWAYVQCPHPAVRRMLAENLYEEETGGLVAGRPHPQLFLEYPKGLGMDLQRFEQVELLPAARRYRERLDGFLKNDGWEVACAVATVFVEGTGVGGTACLRAAPAIGVPVVMRQVHRPHGGLLQGRYAGGGGRKDVCPCE